MSAASFSFGKFQLAKELHQLLHQCRLQSYGRVLEWIESIWDQIMTPLGAVHKLRHFKIDLYGSSNNDST